MISPRRNAIISVAAISILTVSIVAFGSAAASPAESRPYYDAAMKAARWLLDSAVKTGPGGALAWPADPRDPASVNASLYAGTPGVVLFLIEAHRASGDRSFLDAARAGGDSLLAAVASESGAGFYEGVGGAAFALRELFKATRDRRYDDGFRAALEKIRASAVEKGAGVEWGGTTDIVSGAAGTGLLLVYAARETGSGAWLDLAARAGRRLIESGIPEAGGLKWAMDPSFPRLMPNFSHGTAGIAYFLATLYGETRDRVFLDAARAGARYLQAVAKTDGGVCLIFHDEPDNTDLYYLGWCHGPVGTARLFVRLAEVAGDASWLDWLDRSVKALRDSGIPESTTPGFWKNAGICCGLAGAGEFLLDVGRYRKDAADTAFARRFADRLLATADVRDGRVSWPQAEHRTRPEWVIAQTGYMQGAAGIGMFLLEMDAADRNGRAGIAFPDSPFAR